MIPTSHSVRSVLALIALLLVQCSDYLWGAVYHHAHPAWVLGVVVLVYALLFGVLVWLACRLVTPARTLWLLDFLSLQLFFYFVLVTMRRLHMFEGALSLPLKLALAGASVGAGGWLLWRSDSALRARINSALIGAAALFALTPPLVAAVSAAPSVFPVRAAGMPDAPNVLVILLDELGDQAAAPVVDALRRQGLQVSRAALAPLGENTVNVIPAMLTGKDFGAAQPCSASAICSGDAILDFSRMRSVEPRMDIVGFHHPYCAIAGLRSCYQALTPSIENPFVWFGCVLLKATTRISTAACDWRLLTVAQVGAARRELLAAAARAPFWREGGVLFVHVPLPHPPGKRDGANLDQDYEANLLDAAALVESLAVRMRQSFGARHALVISSDHPLRPKVWCAMARYAAAGCAVRPAFVDTRIPLLVATPGAAPPGAVARGIFGAVNQLRGASAGP